MEITVFDVGRGFCALVLGGPGAGVLIGCPSDEATDFHPSAYLRRYDIAGLDALVVDACEEDRLGDLPQLLEEHAVATLGCNRSLPLALLREAAAGRPGLGALVALLERGPPPRPQALPGLHLRLFHNRYPEVSDMGDLSVVSFVGFGDVRAVFPGALGASGWRRLLALPAFRQELATVNVMVASRHGAAEGLCAEVFAHCRPDVVVVPDRPLGGAAAADYGPFAGGLRFDDGRTRGVLATSEHGTLRITQTPFRPAVVHAGAASAVLAP